MYCCGRGRLCVAPVDATVPCVASTAVAAAGAAIAAVSLLHVANSATKINKRLFLKQVNSVLKHVN